MTPFSHVLVVGKKCRRGNAAAPALRHQHHPCSLVPGLGFSLRGEPVHVCMCACVHDNDALDTSNTRRSRTSTRPTDTRPGPVLPRLTHAWWQTARQRARGHASAGMVGVRSQSLFIPLRPCRSCNCCNCKVAPDRRSVYECMRLYVK